MLNLVVLPSNFQKIIISFSGFSEKIESLKAQWLFKIENFVIVNDMILLL